MILPPPLPTQKHLDHASAWQLVLSIIGLTFSTLSVLGLLVVSKLAKSASSTVTFNQAGFTPLFWMLGLMIVLAIPSIIYASRRIQGKVSQPLTVGPRQLIIAVAAIVLWAGMAFVGQNLTRWHLPSGLVYPIDLLVVALPIFFLLCLGLYGLAAGSRQRAWAMINVLIFLSFQVIFFLEMVVILLVVIVASLWLFRQPEYASYLSLFSQKLTEQSLAPLMSQMTTLISKPGFYAAVGFIFCLLVPLIEEAFKPLGVWFLAGKKLAPAQGFAAGLISGAAFGLIESFSMVMMVSGSTWLTSAVARIGTGLLHMFTAGLSGWALAKTWEDQKYFRVVLTYLGMALLHGVWNLFALLLGISNIAVPINSTLLNRLMPASTPVLGGLAVLMLAGLFLINYFLRRKTIPPEQPEISDTLGVSTK
jgi:hypothetical protein